MITFQNCHYLLIQGEGGAQLVNEVSKCTTCKWNEEKHYKIDNLIQSSQQNDSKLHQCLAAKSKSSIRTTKQQQTSEGIMSFTRKSLCKKTARFYRKTNDVVKK